MILDQAMAMRRLARVKGRGRLFIIAPAHRPTSLDRLQRSLRCNYRGRGGAIVRPGSSRSSSLAR
jgi:hypothetical protein